MKKIVILGAGTAGTIVANRFKRLLDFNQWQVTLVDPDPVHYYQPGFLFIPFRMYSEKDVIKPKRDFIDPPLRLIQSKVEAIDADHNRVHLADGTNLPYDFLIIATGVDIHPEETPGMLDGEWGKSIHSFYTLPTSQALRDALRTWKGGRLVVNVVDNPIKCPVAPLEFIMLADWYFHQQGVRDRVEIVYATPLSGAFTKPVASKLLGELLDSKNIKVEPDFMIERVEPEAKKIVSYDEREIEYDLLVTIPLNKGADVIGKSGLGNELNLVPVDPHTLRAKAYPNIFVLGDASDAPASKAGATAHFSIDLFTEHFLDYVETGELPPYFDGHANCFIETGFGKGLMIDFNYTQEPLPGRYPLPGIGPLTLLQESEFNHWGKLMFRWMYWHILLRGMELPLPATMSMAGKWKV
ncbi:MAG: type III sulfide quinone reductase, selenoprotein subtype [Thermanaerothrix sp.]|jgi:sulfide:quinone oxidoreductase|uniref:FAD/NAD(P)-binding oxidoreductase n=2 Tax=Thermanaerothrix TaxID=1077886 RepID=A0ABU3NNG4_9CHLR|nr:FAD/NAD(P)-binding oxidoreductase [Thermanaerothrix sp. 4228-RoL]MDT8897895.1 FAD/NAD(P)-binding oxidoreductase [Thermanaerothrix sp. 4228-RoL]